jgi:hypothetical protein
MSMTTKMDKAYEKAMRPEDCILLPGDQIEKTKGKTISEFIPGQNYPWCPPELALKALLEGSEPRNLNKMHPRLHRHSTGKIVKSVSSSSCMSV